jgi:hypothetical protein
MTNAKWSASERNFGTIDEGDTGQHEVKATLDPCSLLFGELQRFAQCGPARQYQFNATVDLTYLEENSSGSGTAPNEEIDVRAARQRQFAGVHAREVGHDRSYPAPSRLSIWQSAIGSRIP